MIIILLFLFLLYNQKEEFYYYRRGIKIVRVQTNRLLWVNMCKDDYYREMNVL